jgi:PhzF family phenazine biosynthesis protein
MPIQMYQVDAFTSKPFSGNPAGVCLLPEPRNDDWLQDVAREMNLSETAFLRRQEDGFDLRWFTPAVEVALCGHATLASAHVLWESGVLEPEMTARFHTLSGLLSAQRAGDWIEMDFPTTPDQPVSPPPELAEALGVAVRYAGRNEFDYLIEVDSEQMVRDLAPDFELLKRHTDRGLIVTSRAASSDYDFVSRFFAPAVGINEDPVTGSAHCTLGPFWSRRLGKDSLTAYQASPRGGLVARQSQFSAGSCWHKIRAPRIVNRYFLDLTGGGVAYVIESIEEVQYKEF